VGEGIGCKRTKLICGPVEIKTMQLERNDENHAAVARKVGGPSMGIIGIDTRTFWRYLVLVVAGTAGRREIRLKSEISLISTFAKLKTIQF